jgi:hypothetical protein
MKRQWNDWRNDWRIVLLASAICASVYILHPGVARAVGPQEPPTAGRDFGLGVVIGDPTGLSGEKWLGQRTALDFSAAWSLESDESMELAMDHVWYDSTPSRRIMIASRCTTVSGRVQFVDSGNVRRIRFPSA